MVEMGEGVIALGKLLFVSIKVRGGM